MLKTYELLTRHFNWDRLPRARAPRRLAMRRLIGDRIVAGFDLKTDRQRQKLLVQRWNWVGRASRAHRQQVEAALHEFERFQSCR